MKAVIDAAKEAGDTVGGSREVIFSRTAIGPGRCHVQWTQASMDASVQALMSIQAIKGVCIGIGPKVADLPGLKIRDETSSARRCHAASGGATRFTNNAGGLEAVLTNGEDLRVTGYMKPIATLMKPLRSVDQNTLELSPAAIERSAIRAQ